MSRSSARQVSSLTFVAIACGLALACASREAKRDGASPRVELPPLIDRELLFGDADISGGQISPDGAFVVFMRPFKGTRNVWVKRTEESFDQARPITAETARPIAGYSWTRDGRYVTYVRDDGGNENFNVYAVDPSAAVDPSLEVPAARNLTNLPGVRAIIYAAARKDPDLLYIGLNDRDRAWHDIYRLRISTGERELVLSNTERFTGIVLDLQDQLRLVLRSAASGDTEILRVDADGLTKIYTCGVFEACSPQMFHKDGRRVYLASNRGDENDLIGLRLLDVATGREERIETDPEGRVDLGSALFSDLKEELIGTAYVDDRTRVYWRDAEREADYKLLREKLPGREIVTQSSTRDEQLVLVAARSDVEPGEVYLFDRKTKQLTLQYRLRPEIPREHLAAMQSIRYPSSDGIEIPAYLVLPKGVPAENLPLLVLPHGGPWGRDVWNYDPLAQFLANRGFAVLKPNFRGSTGYGKKFLDAGNRQWGDKMQDDITWGVKHLVAKGIADPERVAIFGISYGGYATLAGVAFTPDQYVAAVSMVGPSNLITLLKTVPPYWAAGLRTFHARMGDPTTPEGRAQLERQSPLNSADKIRTPLMVIQGKNDPRVNKAESDQIVAALRDRDFPVEYLVAPDEGHGFAKPVNSMAAFAAMEKFLARHVPGIRYQESMKPEVAARLAAITVDPKTVSVTPPVGDRPAPAGGSAP